MEQFILQHRRLLWKWMVWRSFSSAFPHSTTLSRQFAFRHTWFSMHSDLNWILSHCGPVALTAWIQSGCNFPRGVRPASSDLLSSGNKLQSPLRGLNSRSRFNIAYLTHVLCVYEEVAERKISLSFLLVLWPVSFVCTEILITQQGYEKVFTSKLISMRGGSCCLWIRK